MGRNPDTRIRAGVVIAAFGAAAAPATIDAEAAAQAPAPRPGLYAGFIGEGIAGIGFRLTRARIQVVVTTPVSTTCTDGSASTLSATGRGGFASNPLRRSRFRLHVAEPGLDFVVRGRARGARVQGTLRFTARLNASNAIDPNGVKFCDTGTLSWTATPT